MPDDIIEMLWGCQCGSENRGRFKTCEACGRPRDENSPEWMPGDVSPMAAVKDPELLKKAKAGADWTCRFCKSSQFRLDGNCARCGSDQIVSTATGAPKWAEDWAQNILLRDALSSPAETQMRRRSLGTNSTRQSSIRIASNLSQARDPEETREEPEPEPEPFITSGSYREAPIRRQKPSPPPPPVKIPWRIIGAVAAVLGLGLGLYFLFRTKELDVTVSEVYWSKTVGVDRYQKLERDGWSPDPGAVEVRNEGTRIHHYNHVLVGSHREPYEEEYKCGENCTIEKGTCTTTPRNCKSNKNGFASCTGGDRVCSPDTKTCSPKICKRQASRKVDDYEDQPEYRPYYSWRVWDWAPNRDVSSSGLNTITHWPTEESLALNQNTAPGELERVGRRQEYFHVSFVKGKETWKYEPKSDEEFGRFPLGSPHRIQVSVARGVSVIR